MIDIGANLTDKTFKNDLEAVIERAQQNGVNKMVATGTLTELSRRAQGLAQGHPGILYYTAGVHPHQADGFNDQSIEELSKLGSQGAVAIGETGLDYFRDFSSRTNQRKAFQAQLELAADLDLPVFVHDRDSDAEVFNHLNQYAKTPVVVHCFTGNRMQLEAYLEFGCSIGLTGWVCDERRGQEVAELIHLIPDDRLLIETDAPYLMPRNINPRPKTRRNEPMNLKFVLQRVAELRNQSIEEVDQLTSANATQFFSLDKT